MNIEQFDALLVNQAAMDYDLMQFLRSFDDDEEQPQEQLFTLPTDEFDATGLPNPPAGPELQPLRLTEPLLAIPENTVIPSKLNLETTLYTSLNTYLQNTPQIALVQHYQPIIIIIIIIIVIIIFHSVCNLNGYDSRNITITFSRTYSDACLYLRRHRSGKRGHS
jgi:hypothetical protein